MTWNVIYDDLTGGDVAAGGYLSVASVVADPLPAGLSMKVITGPPQQEQWNTSTLEWEPVPAPPPDVDRVDEFLGRVGVVFNGGSNTKIRNELAAMLAGRRFRDPSETYEIEDR